MTVNIFRIAGLLAASASVVVMTACTSSTPTVAVERVDSASTVAPTSAPVAPTSAVTTPAVSPIPATPIPDAAAARPGEPAPSTVTTEQFTAVGRLVLSTEAGRITVTGADTTQITMTRRVFRTSVDPSETVRRDGDALVVGSGCVEDDSPRAPCRIDYEIQVPRTVPVELVSASGDVTVTAAGGPVTARSTSGTVAVVGNEAATTFVSSVSGDVDVQAQRRPDLLEATSTSGNVTVTVPSGPYRVEGGTVSGESELGVGSDAGAAALIRVRTVSGDLSVAPR